MNQEIDNNITTSLMNLNSSEFSNTKINIMLTGGRGASELYRQWQEALVFKNICKPVNLFLTDERCVNPNSLDSNHFMVNQVLFAGRTPKNVTFKRMFSEKEDFESEAYRYEALLPDSIDLMLLSMGEDGHICSLFPGSPLLYETKRKVKTVVGPKRPFHRLTITPSMIKSTKNIFVLAIGDEKKRKYEEALHDPDDISSIPARLVLDRTWIFSLNEEINICQKF